MRTFRISNIFFLAFKRESSINNYHFWELEILCISDKADDDFTHMFFTRYRRIVAEKFEAPGFNPTPDL